MFQGVKFIPTSQGYFTSTKGCIRMHRFVWEYYNDKIPQGLHIHHINGDRTDNKIENLQLVTIKQHRKLHSKKGGLGAI